MTTQQPALTVDQFPLHPAAAPAAPAHQLQLHPAAIPVPSGNSTSRPASALPSSNHLHRLHPQATTLLGLAPALWGHINICPVKQGLHKLDHWSSNLYNMCTHLRPFPATSTTWPYSYTYDLHQALRSSSKPSWSSRCIVTTKLQTAESTTFYSTGFQHLRYSIQHKHYPAIAILPPWTSFVLNSLNKNMTFKLIHLSSSFV